MARNEHLAVRNHEIFTRHLAGETQTALAKEYGISQGRVWSICQHHRRLKTGRDAWPGIIRDNRNALLESKIQRLALGIGHLHRLNRLLKTE